MRILAVLAVLAIISFSFSATIPDSQLASSANVQILESGTVTATGGQIMSLDVNIPLPASSAYQSVQASGQSHADSQGNPYIKVVRTRRPTRSIIPKR